MDLNSTHTIISYTPFTYLQSTFSTLRMSSPNGRSAEARSKCARVICWLLISPVAVTLHTTHMGLLCRGALMYICDVKVR